MTKLRYERNCKIKKAVMAQIHKGFSTKEALYIVAEHYYLSAKQVERIYYETRIEQ